MATVFSVIGAYPNDPDRLILLGDDGQHYELEPMQGTPTPVEPSEEWLIDPVIADEDEIEGWQAT